MRGALIAGVGLAIFQQFVDPNTVLFYTPTIFGYAGVSGNPLMPTIFVGIVLFVFVFPTIAFVDVIGSKALFYIGLVGMGSMLVLLGIAFQAGPGSWGAAVVIILLVRVAFYSLSIYPLFWLMSAEVFPNRLRGTGASASTVANSPPSSPEVIVRLDPSTGIRILLGGADPGSDPIRLDAAFAQEGNGAPTPYEVLLGEALRGDSAHFTRQDNVEECWRIIEPLLNTPGEVHPYPRGSRGPEAADGLVAEYGGWHRPWLDDRR